MTTKENKSEAILIRVDKNTKTSLEKLATQSRRNLSDYLRLVFEDIIKTKKIV